MQTVSVQTTQNIDLEYPLAGIGERMLAFLLDLLIIFFFYIIIGLIAAWTGIDVPQWMYYIGGIIGYSYRLLSEAFFSGQTVGKSVLKIKVVKLDGKAPSFPSYFLRWIMEPLDFLIVGLAVLLIILNKNGQRLGDLLANTTVVKMKKITATNVRNKMIMKKVDEDYQPTYPEAAEISDADIRIIKQALTAFREDAAHKAVNALEGKLKEKYNIQSDEPPVKLFYTLLRDHAYYVSQD